MRCASLRLPGHPDAACDLVAEAIVDEYLDRDPETRIRVDVVGGHGALFVSGEVRSSADVDVAAVVRRVLGKIGSGSEIEPFISLESVSSGLSAISSAGMAVPLTVIGYACSETPERLPLPVALTIRLAKQLQAYRETDEQGFWLGPDAECAIILKQNAMPQIILNVEHGTIDIADVRSRLSNVISSVIPGTRSRVNDLGPVERRGLAKSTGGSGRHGDIYGTLMPSTLSVAGLDPHHPLKAGAWLARAAARELVGKGANAALVQLTYEPGRAEPLTMIARDEKGKRLDAQLDPKKLYLDRVMRDWWRKDLNQDAIRWGLAGDAALPWEA